ncbi:MAG: phosphopentomutase [Rhizobiaceae bacterium]|nr:phosphopentomutase [Rhizobiaceae bacterium]
MARAILIVLDSVGIGGAPDAEVFGDTGSNTLGHIAEQCANGGGDKSGLRSGPLRLPNMEKMGLGFAAEAACGERPAGMEFEGEASAGWACAAEVSSGKDTPSGHWEIAGVPVRFDWGVFPQTIPTFPQSLTDAMIEQADLPGVLANKHASGTEVIAEFGHEHIQTGKPIVYTSADSVVQIAAHEEFFGLDRLYKLCAITRKLVDPLNIGRVIARPFVGMSPDTFERTGNRRDYSVPPPEPTLLDRVEDDDSGVFAVGKIADIFAHRGVTDIRKANGNEAMFDATLQAIKDAANGDLVFANFVDFDQLYGHRRDVPGYAACLEHFDRRLPELMALLREGDMMILTADHGNDPTWHGTDHTREQVPVLLTGSGLKTGFLGKRTTFADIGETLAAHLGLAAGPHGQSML